MLKSSAFVLTTAATTLDMLAFGFIITTKSTITRYEAANSIIITTIPSITAIPCIIASLITFDHSCFNIYYSFL